MKQHGFDPLQQVGAEGCIEVSSSSATGTVTLRLCLNLTQADA